MVAAPWSQVAGGIRLTPKGGRDAIDGLKVMSDGTTALKVRVRAAPTEGQANAELIVLIARAVGVPQRDVDLASGATSRLKRLVISADGPTLIAELEKIVAAR